MEAATASRTGDPQRERPHALGVALAGFTVIVATIVYGLATGSERLGTPLPPFLYDWDPEVGVLAPVAVAVLALGVVLAPRLHAPALSPLAFGATALALALALRLGVAVARDGVLGWYGVYAEPSFEAANEYLPALPALDFGLRAFLDTFAEIATALPVHAAGHPPGLLATMHLLGIDSAQGMAALTIGAGALSVPLTYALARRLLDETRARTATLLYAFAPSAVLHGATSADALYATLALLAVVALVSAHRRISLTLGPAALALASLFSYANLAVGAFATLIVARRDGLRRALLLAVTSAAGLGLAYALLHLVSGFDPFGALASTATVYGEGIASRRPYAFWLLGSPVAFLVAAGVPLAWLGLRALGARETVAVSLFAVVAISALLGYSKAETERIYLFLVPLLCLAAASVLPERRLTAVLGALAIQALAMELALLTVW